MAHLRVGSLTTEQNIKLHPTPPSIWKELKPYMAKHSPIGALRLLLGCLKLVGSPRGDWLTPSKVFGDANFFAERRDLIEVAESLQHLPKMGTEATGDYVITPPLTSREANAWMIPDLLVMIMEDSPYTREVYIDRMDKDEGEKYSTAYRQQPYPHITNSWPFYHYPSESWRVIFRPVSDEERKFFRPARATDVISFIRGVAFQTWLGRPYDVVDPRDWGGGHEVLAAVLPFEAKSEIAHHQYGLFGSISEEFLKGHSLFVKKMAQSLLEYPYDAGLFQNGNDNVGKSKPGKSNTFGLILAAYALSHPSEDDLNVEEWIGYYDRMFGDDRQDLFKFIGKTPVKISDVPSVWPKSKTKRSVKFVD